MRMIHCELMYERKIDGGSDKIDPLIVIILFHFKNLNFLKRSENSPRVRVTLFTAPQLNFTSVSRDSTRGDKLRLRRCFCSRLFAIYQKQDYRPHFRVSLTQLPSFSHPFFHSSFYLHFLHLLLIPFLSFLSA